MRKIAFIISITLISFLVSGCMNLQQRILDDIQLVTALGFGYVDGNSVEITAVFPDFQPDKSVKSKTLTGQDVQTKAVRNKINLQSEKPFVGGKIEVLLFDKKISENGIAQLLDQFQRNPSIGSKVYLAVLKGNTKDILSKQYGKIDNGIFLSNLIEQNIDTGLLARTNLHLFSYASYSDGMDAWLPIIEGKGDTVNISAIGLFKRDKLVVEISEQDFFLFKILLENKTNHETSSIQLANGEELSIFNIDSKRKFDIPKPMTNSEIVINLELNSIIREYSDKHLSKKKMKKLEKEVEDNIEKNANKIIKRFQEAQIDPLGIGEQVRTRSRNWDKKKWNDLYPQLHITVQTKVNILESGVIE